MDVDDDDGAGPSTPPPAKKARLTPKKRVTFSTPAPPINRDQKNFISNLFEALKDSNELGSDGRERDWAM